MSLRNWMRRSREIAAELHAQQRRADAFAREESVRRLETAVQRIEVAAGIRCGNCRENVLEHIGSICPIQNMFSHYEVL